MGYLMLGYLLRALIFVVAGAAFWFAHYLYVEGDVLAAGVFVALGISTSVEVALLKDA